MRRSEGVKTDARLPPRDERPRRAGKHPRHLPARPRSPHQCLRRARDEWRCGQHRGAHLRRSTEGRAGQQGESQRDRGQDHRRRPRRVPARRRGSVAASRRSGSGPTATCSSRSRRETRRSAYTTCTGSSRAIRSSSPPVSTATSPGSGTCGRSTGAALGSAPWETYFDTPYYEQLQYIGDTRIQALISLYMTRRRSSRAPGDRALRRLAHSGRDHRQPLPVGSRPVHSDVLTDLGRDGARLLDAPRRCPSTCAASCPVSGLSSAGSSNESTRPACSVRCRGGTSWTGRGSGTGECPRAASRGTPR